MIGYQRVLFLFVISTLLTPSERVVAQTPAAKPAQKSAAKPATPAPAAEVAGPQQTKHYPILVVAHGNEPFWGLRLGMKGPERLDRVGYPPMVLEPVDVVRDETGNIWTYQAKDSATGAAVSVKLMRDSCSDGMSDTKYTFKVSVDHAQIGTLHGCGQSSPEKFPEFRKKNQLDPAENADAGTDKDKDKFSVLEPITKFVSPTAVAYLDPAGKVVLSRGEVKKTVAPAGTELALSHDGKKLLCTRSDSKTGPERTIVLYDADSGHSKDLLTGLVRQAFWSPDDTRIAFLKNAEQKWQIWTFAVSDPEKATVFYSGDIVALQGWVTPDTVLANDMQNAYWIGAEGKVQQTVALKSIYGNRFQIMSSDTIRTNPVNADLLLVTADYTAAPAGAPVDMMGLNSAFFLYEVKSKRQVILCPTDTWGRSAEWSRDGIQIYFSRLGTGSSFVINRMFWDGTGVKRYLPGSGMAIGK
jgi:uncharacterized membrane protein